MIQRHGMFPRKRTLKFRWPQRKEAAGMLRKQRLRMAAPREGADIKTPEVAARSTCVSWVTNDQESTVAENLLKGKVLYI
jgi:hypothetical protein